MGRDAQKRHFQALFSHSDKFFRYEMSGNFERKKGKASKDFPLQSPLSSTDTRSVFVVCFHQASVVTAQVDRQQRFLKSTLDFIGKPVHYIFFQKY